jgi:hypothetical protein
MSRGTADDKGKITKLNLALFGKREGVIGLASLGEEVVRWSVERGEFFENLARFKIEVFLVRLYFVDMKFEGVDSFEVFRF